MAHAAPVGLIGLGKMGAGMARRLLKSGFSVYGYDHSKEMREEFTAAGGQASSTLRNFVRTLPVPRVVWLMLPSFARGYGGQASLSPVDQTLVELQTLLGAGDLVVDGGNSHFKDSVVRARELAAQGIRFVDVGVSGGVGGEQLGYALMVGGELSDVERLRPLLAALAPASDEEAISVHVGPVGAGHFVKMVHNAVEYGMMQAIAEGFDLLTHGPFSTLDPAQVADLWNQGTIIRSFLMELVAQILRRDSDLAALQAYVNDSGEGRWSVEAALEAAVPFSVNTAALYARFASRQPDSYAMKLLAALRQEFGGHAVTTKT